MARFLCDIRASQFFWYSAPAMLLMAKAIYDPLDWLEFARFTHRDFWGAKCSSKVS